MNPSLAVQKLCNLDKLLKLCASVFLSIYMMRINFYLVGLLLELHWKMYINCLNSGMQKISASLCHYYYLVIFSFVQLLKESSSIICNNNRGNIILCYMNDQSIQLDRDHGPDSVKYAQIKNKPRFNGGCRGLGIRSYFPNALSTSVSFLT